MAMSEKMKKFCHAKLQGMSNKDAAIAAGYSPASAAMRGSILAADPRIQSYLAAALKSGGEGGVAIDVNSLLPIVADADAKTLAMIDDPLDYLKSIFQNPHEDKKLRIQAAQAALPYVHGKVGDTGKKQSKADSAKANAKAGGRFGTLDSKLDQLPS